ASHSHSRNGDASATSAFHSSRGTRATPSSTSIVAPTAPILRKGERAGPPGPRAMFSPCRTTPDAPPVRPSARRPDHPAPTPTATRRKVARAPKYKVLLYNDHYTPMEFVVAILENLFGKGPTEATQIMLAIHRTGLGVAGVYVQDVAETKVAAVHSVAEQRGY